MNRKYGKLKIFLMAAFVILFSGIYASADWEKGYGHHRRMHQGQEWHHMGYGGPGCGAFDNLSEDDINKLDEERTAFFEATKDLRRKVYQKRLELASELAKENPDAAEASALQREISDFKAQMAQKRLDHILRVQKIDPDLGRRFWDGNPMGPAMTHRSLMGRGGKGKWGPCNGSFRGPRGGYGMGPRRMHRGGYGMMESGGEGSWGPSNYPHVGPGGGYGMGPRMMHRGGYSMGYGCGSGPKMMGPGGSDRVDSRKYYKEQDSQLE